MISAETLALMERDLAEKREKFEAADHRRRRAVPGSRCHAYHSRAADHWRSEAMTAERFVRRARRRADR